MTRSTLHTLHNFPCIESKQIKTFIIFLTTMSCHVVTQYNVLENIFLNSLVFY